ncbi:MAG: hypothetical protein ACOH18_05500 [Candidatus Saccharimonadaceae bacterium]
MIASIEFPNTVVDEAKTYYVVGPYVDEIKPIMKAGEMAGVQWFQIIKDGMILAEIKESICNVYFKDRKVGEDIF